MMYREKKRYIEGLLLFTASCLVMFFASEVKADNGEEQQYPPAEVEAWVQSTTGGGLVDVPLNDQRWGDREEGEVYARENENFIVWYWPNGGEATFDPTTLGSQAIWHDYRTASDRSSGGGPMPIFPGMQIFFRDSGGGVSIFERISNEPHYERISNATQIATCSDFQTEFINPEQSNFPADRVYPMGQKMMITAWGSGATAGRVQELYNAGFTMVGPDWNPTNSQWAEGMAKARQLNMRVAYRVTNGASTAHELFKRMDNGPKEEALFRQARSTFNKALNNPDLNSQVDVWLTGTEELSTRMKTPEQRTQGLRYLQKMEALRDELDSQNRPLWMSDVTGVSQAQMMVTHKYTGMVGPQNYMDRCCVGGGYKTDAVVGDAARKVVSTARALDSLYPQARPHAATMSHGLHYTPLSQERIDNMDRIIPYWVFTAFNEGLQGMQVYSWYNHYTSISAEARESGKAAYMAAVKLLTDHGLDYVFLWGDRRTDLTMEILSGPATTYGYPSISMSNIHYNNHRYVILTNAAEEAVKVQVSGFPLDCVKTYDVLMDNYRDNNGQVSLILQPLDIRLYKFEAL